jgi:hypothetical protein
VSGPSGVATPTGTMGCTPTPTPSGSVTVSPLVPTGASAKASCSFAGTPGTSYTTNITYTPDSSSSQAYQSWTIKSSPITAP